MKNDIKIGALFVLFSLFVYFYLIPNQISASLGFGRVALGPRYFPMLSTIILGSLSLLLVIQNIFLYQKKSEAEKKEKEPHLLEKKDLKVLGLIIILLIFINLYAYTHFLLAIFVTTLSLLYYFGSRKHILNLILSVSTMTSLYLLFIVLLGISL